MFSDGNFCISFQDIHSFPEDHSLPWGPAFRAMTVCHSLIVWQGKIQGDPLDVKMFEATNWVKLCFVAMQIVVGSFGALAKEKCPKPFNANSHFQHRSKTGETQKRYHMLRIFEKCSLFLPRAFT